MMAPNENWLPLILGVPTISVPLQSHDYNLGPWQPGLTNELLPSTLKSHDCYLLYSIPAFPESQRESWQGRLQVAGMCLPHQCTLSLPFYTCAMLAAHALVPFPICMHCP